MQWNLNEKVRPKRLPTRSMCWMPRASSSPHGNKSRQRQLQSASVTGFSLEAATEVSLLQDVLQGMNEDFITFDDQLVSATSTTQKSMMQLSRKKRRRQLSAVEGVKQLDEMARLLLRGLDTSGIDRKGSLYLIWAQTRISVRSLFFH